jgi:hypothetical protein
MRMMVSSNLGNDEGVVISEFRLLVCFAETLTI